MTQIYVTKNLGFTLFNVKVILPHISLFVNSIVSLLEDCINYTIWVLLAVWYFKYLILIKPIFNYWKISFKYALTAWGLICSQISCESSC